MRYRGEPTPITFVTLGYKMSNGTSQTNNADNNGQCPKGETPVRPIAVRPIVSTSTRLLRQLLFLNELLWFLCFFLSLLGLAGEPLLYSRWVLVEICHMIAAVIMILNISVLVEQ